MPEVRWVTVLEAERPRAEVVRGMLDAAGIATFVPDDFTKTVDPFITGGNVFTLKVQVPEEDVERARALLDVRAETGAADDVTDGPGADVRRPTAEPDGEDEADDPIERHAARTVMLTFLIVTMPFALISGLVYVVAWLRTGRRARLHGLVLTALAVMLVLGGVFLYLALRPVEKERFDPLSPIPIRPSPPRDPPIGR